MRICVVGGGLAGALLAWRLADTPAVASVTLLSGPAGTDATASSGGVVRGFEFGATQRRLAIDSMLELRGSVGLRRWSGFREIPCVTITDRIPPGVDEVAAAIPGSIDVASAAELAELGFAALPAGTVGVVERCAGAIDPDRLRHAVLAELAGYSRVRIMPPGAADPRPDGDWAVGDAVARADATVLAAGAWTAQLLGRAGHDPAGYRTKSVRYVLARAPGWRPPSFTDETSGFYGTSTRDAVLLGLATSDWDVAPGAGSMPPAEPGRLAELAARHLPRLSIDGPLRAVASSDCYTDPPVLQLRRIDSRLFTFTGGSGGAAKTVLAASRIAARQLVQSDHPLTTTGAPTS